jgi:hypothetical protein
LNDVQFGKEAQKSTFRKRTSLEGSPMSPKYFRLAACIITALLPLTMSNVSVAQSAPPPGMMPMGSNQSPHLTPEQAKMIKQLRLIQNDKTLSPTQKHDKMVAILQSMGHVSIAPGGPHPGMMPMGANPAWNMSPAQAKIMKRVMQIQNDPSLTSVQKHDRIMALLKSEHNAFVASGGPHPGMMPMGGNQAWHLTPAQQAIRAKMTRT